MEANRILEVQIKGMDCADCVMHVQKALTQIPGVDSAEVYLGAEKAVIYFQNVQPSAEAITHAVHDAGYEASFASDDIPADDKGENLRSFGRASIGSFLAIVLFVLAITFFGERSGVIARLQGVIPWFVWLAAILAGGWPVFSHVARALLKKRIISHTLMSASVLTAMLVGEWATALLIVLFMRLGDLIERSTTEKARLAVHALRRSAPQTAHLINGEKMNDVPISALRSGDVVQVKPGESIPVDGIVLDGSAIVDQAAITGESMPVTLTSGDTTYAASIIRSGTLRIETTGAGKESLFGRIIMMVEEAEANRGAIQTLADRFSSIYLPIVGGIALTTFIISGDAIAAAAVMAVSCSCSFSLATPVAMLATIGTAAGQGVLFKGGKYIEILETIDTVFIDKTGTLTTGEPSISDIVIFSDHSEDEIISFASSVEQFSEHPLAHAVLRLAAARQVDIQQAHGFTSTVGKEVSAYVGTQFVTIGNAPKVENENFYKKIETIRNKGKTLIFVQIDGRLCAVLGSEDTLRPDVERSIAELKAMGLENIWILSGDHIRAVERIAERAGVAYRAELMPQDKIKCVQEAQNKGARVMMIGDGINDAPALAQADIGIAMGASGTDIAIETAHIVLLREDWSLIPEAVRTARRTMRVVRLNIFLTAVYNLVGISFAAAGLLAPAVAAAMQSFPDVGIMANSARLLQRKRKAS